jgi:predicted ArsR family transcriptional regulator
VARDQRRHPLGHLDRSLKATATALAAELPVTGQAVSKHLAALARVGGEWDARLARLRRHLAR